MSRTEALARTILLSRDFVGDEHTDNAIVSALSTTSVCIVSDEKNLSMPSGQAAVTTLVSLVLQMGCHVRLVLPAIDIRGHQPPLRGVELCAALVELGADVIPDTVVEVAKASTANDLVFVIGDSSWSGVARDAWRLVGGRWWGGTCAPHTTGSRWASGVPMGALAAATVGAAEVYKCAIRPLAGAIVRDQLSRVETASVRLGDESFDPSGVDIGAVDCVSGGAIAQAFCHALFRIPGVKGSLRVLEPERLDLTNLNRYALARRSLVGAMKISLIALWAPSTLTVSEVECRVDADHLPKFGAFNPRVVVGTDDIPSRWFVQAQRPTWLAVGATTHFLAVSSEHERGLACAKCMHPRDDNVRADIPTVSFASYWGGLMLAARLLRHAAGRPCPVDEQAMWLPSLQLAGRFSQHRYRVEPDAACDCAA